MKKKRTRIEIVKSGKLTSKKLNKLKQFFLSFQTGFGIYKKVNTNNDSVSIFPSHRTSRMTKTKSTFVPLQEGGLQAFTLVELIVGIVILTILASIGFISYMGYSSQARDIVRVQDLKNVEKELLYLKAKNKEFPDPDNYNGNLVEIEGVNWKIGTMGETAIKELRGLTKIPIDPITGSGYLYMISESGLSYKLEANLENSLKNNPNEENPKIFALGNYKKAVIKDCRFGNFTIKDGETDTFYSENQINSVAGYDCDNKKLALTCNIRELKNIITNTILTETEVNSNSQTYKYKTCIKGIPKNCKANASFTGTTYTLTQTYNLEALNHSQTGTLETDITENENHGIFTYQTEVTCNDGNISNTEETKTLKSCDTDYHTNSTNDGCESNTQNCSITNGTGRQIWTGTAWGTCMVQSCNTNFHKVGNTCVSNIKEVACRQYGAPGNSSYNSYNVTITWNTSTNSWNSPANCSWSCNLDYYKSGDNCLWVGNGHYSPNKNNTRYNCTNKPANTQARTYTYTTDGNGTNNCSYSTSQNCGIDLYEVNGQCKAVGNGYYSVVNNNERWSCNNKPGNTNARNYYYTSDGNGTANGCSYTYSQKCGVDLYESGNNCLWVGNGYYSLINNNSKPACTNFKPAFSHYTSDGNGLNNCSWGCNTGYIKEGNTCKKTIGTNIVDGGTCTFLYVNGSDSWRNSQESACPYGDLKVICKKGGITTTQVWAGCNSTKGNGYDYNNNPANSIAKDPDFNTIYGKLYTNNQTQQLNNVCTSGWHIPNDKEWGKLIESLGCSNFNISLPGSWQCNGLGYGNHFSQNIYRNLVNILKIPLSGEYNNDNFNGNIGYNRGNATFLVATIPLPSLRHSILLHKPNMNLFGIGVISDNIAISVRCIKD